MGHGNTIFFAFCCMILLPVSRPAPAPAPPPIPAIFAFGDSTVDPGNNNHIGTLFRADHLPYGRAFPDHLPTGRFSDGKLATDYIASALGIKELLPAYLDPSLSDDDLLSGVSFGSAGTGLDELTVNLSDVLDMMTQLDYFDEAKKRMQKHAGETVAGEIVTNALFVISVGTNDLLYNLYLLPTRTLQFSVSGYHGFLLRKLESIIQRLYRQGARKIAVVGVPPVGCLPFQVTVGSLIPSERFCNNNKNRDCEAYNEELKALSSRLQGSLVGAKVAYLDVYGPVKDMVANPSKYGFEVASRGCCGSGFMEMGPTCNLLTPTCFDASKFIFWDAVHLSHPAYSIIADRAADAILSKLL